MRDNYDTHVREGPMREANGSSQNETGSRARDLVMTWETMGGLTGAGWIESFDHLARKLM